MMHLVTCINATVLDFNAISRLPERNGSRAIIEFEFDAGSKRRQNASSL